MLPLTSSPWVSRCWNSPAKAARRSLDELAVPFARHLCEHLELCDKQGTFAKSRFLDGCRAYNRGDLTEAQLIEQTARLGFNNVIDAFHVVNQGDVPVRFFIDERRQSAKGIRLTDEVHLIREAFQYRKPPRRTRSAMAAGRDGLGPGPSPAGPGCDLRT
jgi:hypothetical protein